MTSPLYSVGQHVAVCTSDLSTVIPATVVTDRKWRRPGEVVVNQLRELCRSNGHWSYRTAADQCWTAEWCLRPINPDTEYLTDSAPQKLETTL